MSFLSTSGLITIGHFLGGCTTGIASSLRCMWHVPGNLPIPSKQSGYALIRSSQEFIGPSFFISCCTFSLSGQGLMGFPCFLN